jgi:hypothetical protein
MRYCFDRNVALSSGASVREGASAAEVAAVDHVVDRGQRLLDCAGSVDHGSKVVEMRRDGVP